MSNQGVVSAKRPNFWQRLRRRHHPEQVGSGEIGQVMQKTRVKAADVNEYVWIDAWGEVCPKGYDPSSMARRVSLYR